MNIFKIIVFNYLLIMSVSGDVIRERFAAFTFQGIEYEFILSDSRLKKLPEIDITNIPVGVNKLTAQEELYRKKLATILNIEEENYMISLLSVNLTSEVPGAGWSWIMNWRIISNEADVVGARIGNVPPFDKIEVLVLMDGNPVYPSKIVQ